MRLFFKSAPINQQKFLAATEKFGVGAVHPAQSYLHDTGKTAKVVKCDVAGNPILDAEGKEQVQDAPVHELRQRITFDFHAGEENTDGVLKVAKAAGLEYIGKDDAVECRWNDDIIEPAESDAKDGEAVIVE